MACVGKSTSRAAKKEARPRSPPDKKRLKASEEFSSYMSEEQPQSPTLKGEDIQALAIRPEDLEKLRVPQPPRDSQKPPAMTRVLVRKTRPADDVRRGMRVAVARPLPQDVAAQPLEYTGPGGPRFDAQGMVLPHSILGSLEDFKREMEARGETELVKRVPDLQKVPPSVAGSQSADEKPKPHPRERRDLQSHALQHWYHHMAERRHQQDFISHLLQKPTQSLLMNQSNRFRETQEQRELITRGLPALHPGHGYRVGSEFWSLPQCFGDELSGITATLTQTERGNPESVTHVGQPQSIRLESGNVLADLSDSAGRAWDQSLYLQHRRHELREVLKDLDFNQPEIDGLEVIGTSQPFTSVTVKRSPLLEEEEKEEERSDGEQKENKDPLSLYDDVMLDAVLVPALRFCGEPARWIGSSTSHKGEVGICARLTFEAMVGESVCSYLELHNEGSTAVYYSWQKLNLPHSFPEARAQRHTQHFYFNTSTAVILPGDSQKMMFTFKSASPGIVSEAWRLNTHPVLLGGAALQVTLRGVALYQDKTADQRAALEKELQQREAVSVSRSLVWELLRGVRTPERSSSPAQLYTTEEEHFHCTNPKLHYHHETVETLKRLWEQVIRSGVTGSGEPEDGERHIWDLSVASLRQVVLALPEGDPEVDGEGLYRGEALAEYNSLVLELHQPKEPAPPLPLLSIGLQLWRELLDGLAGEALRLRHVLGLPEAETWGELDHDTWGKMKREKSDKKAGPPPAKEEKKGGSAKEKEEKKGAAKPAPKEKPAEEHPGSKKKVREEQRVGKPGREEGREPSSTATSPENELTEPQHDSTLPELHRTYRRQLHQKVYVLMEGLVDSLCDLLDDARDSQPDTDGLI